MNLRQLEVFQAVMRAGTATGAARLLNVTQPAVSTMLKHMESQLGMTLFERAGARLQPTPEAQLLYPDVSAIFARIESLDHLAAGLRDGRSGLLSVAASATLANAFVTEAAARFREGHPQVGVIVRALANADAIRSVARQQVDFGLCYGPIEDPGVAGEQIAKTEIACILRRDHPLADRDYIGPAELAGQPMISYRPETPLRLRIDAAFRQVGERADFIVQANAMNSCALANLGTGVAILDALATAGDMFPNLTSRPFRPAIPVGVMLVFARGQPRSQLARRFVEQVKATVFPSTVDSV